MNKNGKSLPTCAITTAATTREKKQGVLLVYGGLQIIR